MIVLTISDFDGGKFELHSGMYTQNNIQEYIDKYEKRYLIEMLGADLGGQFIADIQANGGVPIIPIFVDIFNAFNVDYGTNLISSDGVKEMLKGFVYYEYLKDQVSQITAVGMLTPKGENSEKVNTLMTQLYTRYNDACRSYKGVQNYIWTKRGDYTGYNGRDKSFVYWI